MAKKLNGIVSQFGIKGYGFITSDDGERYFVHQKNIYNKLPLGIDTRVTFEADNSEKGWAAVNVVLENSTSDFLSGTTIKILFAVLFITQIAVIYKVFIS